TRMPACAPWPCTASRTKYDRRRGNAPRRPRLAAGGATAGHPAAGDASAGLARTAVAGLRDLARAGLSHASRLAARLAEGAPAAGGCAGIGIGIVPLGLRPECGQRTAAYLLHTRGAGYAPP